MKWIQSAVAVCLLLPLALAGLDAGGKLPDVFASVPIWFELESIVVPKEKTPDVEIVIFFDTTAPDSLNYMRLLNTLSGKFAEEKAQHTVRFSAVTRNSIQDTQNFCKTLGPFGIPIGADDKRTLFLEVAAQELTIPFAVIAKNGKVQWTGNPIEIESVTERILQGKFDLSKQIRIAALRRELQAAVQSALPDVIMRTADSILALLPGDTIAIQAKLFVFQNHGQIRQAMAFICDAANQNADSVNIRLLYLDFLLRGGDAKQFQEQFQKAFSDFEKSSEATLQLLSFALNAPQVGVLPLRAVVDAAKRSARSFEKARPGKYAYVLELLAKSYYLICKPDEAVKYQEQALTLRKGTAQEANAAQVLTYYKSALELRKESL